MIACRKCPAEVWTPRGIKTGMCHRCRKSSAETKVNDMEPMNPDSEAIYDSEIAPLMTQIIAICKANRIPMLASFQYASDEHPEGCGFVTTRIPFDGEHKKLDDARHIMTRRSDAVLGFTISSGGSDAGT